MISKTFCSRTEKIEMGNEKMLDESKNLSRIMYEKKKIGWEFTKILENLVLKEEEGKMWRWKMTNKVATKEEESGDKCEKGEEESVLIDEKENIDEDDKSQFIMCWKMCRISFIIYSIICCVE